MINKMRQKKLLFVLAFKMRLCRIWTGEKYRSDKKAILLHTKDLQDLLNKKVKRCNIFAIAIFFWKIACRDKPESVMVPGT